MAELHLIPIEPRLEDNGHFPKDDESALILQMSVDYYNRIGYHKPWIGYFVTNDTHYIGSAGFKGKPVNNTIEIAYGTFESFRNKGVATQVCRLLVDLALATDPKVRITARTLPENNQSTRVLARNGFEKLGTVVDPEDGEVFEWLYKGK